MSAADAAIAQGNRIREAIEELDRTNDFLDDVNERIADMILTIERTSRVSDKQQSALDNWEAAVNKFRR